MLVKDMKNLFTLEAPGCNYDLLQKMVDEGDLEACVSLACHLPVICMLRGEGNDGIYIGMELLKQTAAKGCGEAMYHLAYFHFTMQEYENQKKCYAMMHDLHVKEHKEHPSLQTEFDLANDLLHGYGIEEDTKTALNIMQSLADRGFGRAFFELGEMYRGFYNHEEDPVAAIREYRKGAELEDPECLKALSKEYTFARNPLKPEEELDLYKVDQKLCKYKYGWHPSQLRMGKNYQYGKYVEANLATAKEYFIAAASMGNTESFLTLQAIDIAEKEFSERYGPPESIPLNVLNDRVKKLIMHHKSFTDDNVPCIKV